MQAYFMSKQFLYNMGFNSKSNRMAQIQQNGSIKSLEPRGMEMAKGSLGDLVKREAVLQYGYSDDVKWECITWTQLTHYFFDEQEIQLGLRDTCDLQKN